MSDQQLVPVERALNQDGSKRARPVPPPFLPARPLYQERLSLPVPSRLLLSASLAAMSGFTLGAAKGGTEAGYRFRAENAHRLPKSQTGWYLYHKSKNYHAMFGGVIEGVKMAGKISVWAIFYVALEEAIDCAREGVTRVTRGQEAADRSSKDFLSSVVAGAGTAGAFSIWNRFPLPTASRTIRTGIKIGFAYGLLQDTLGYLRGRRIGYLEFLQRAIASPAATLVEEVG